MTAAVALLPRPALDEHEEKFAIEYVALGGNATQAYLRAKPTVKVTTAGQEGYKLLKKPHVVDRIAELRRELSARDQMSLEERRRVLESIARADQSDIWETVPGPHGGLRLKPLDELTPEQRHAIQEMDIVPNQFGIRRRVKLYSRLDAIDQLNRMDGLYKQPVEREREVHWVVVLQRELSPDEWAAKYAQRLPTPVGEPR